MVNSHLSFFPFLNVHTAVLIEKKLAVFCLYKLYFQINELIITGQEEPLIVIMCSSRKYAYSPHRRDWNFLGVGVLKD